MRDLKDDDSGDHDQNEENGTQKEGEKEKNDREKSHGSSKRKAVVPGPAEHPLQYNYTFWYSRRTPGRPTSSQSYEQNIKQIGTFASERLAHSMNNLAISTFPPALNPVHTPFNPRRRICTLLEFLETARLNGSLGIETDNS
uniref:Uncharacterized protein n=1 Tax=Sphaerodactylus townsendi TaxID=933632 RepID=A0ACB8FC11_9SAUR